MSISPVYLKKILNVRIKSGLIFLILYSTIFAFVVENFQFTIVTKPICNCNHLSFYCWFSKRNKQGSWQPITQ